MSLVEPLLRRASAAPRSRTSRPWIAAIAVLLFIGGVWMVGNRTRARFVIPGQPDAPAWGMLDFRDAIYFPIVAFLDGNNPYDSSAYVSTYPVGNVFALYTPVTLTVEPVTRLPSAPASMESWVAIVIASTMRMVRMPSGDFSVA